MPARDDNDQQNPEQVPLLTTTHDHLPSYNYTFENSSDNHRQPHERNIKTNLENEEENNDKNDCNNSSCDNHNSQKEDNVIKNVTYYSLFQKNRYFRYYFMSYALLEIAGWFSYVAALSVIERLLDDERNKTAISMLVVVWYLPDIMLSSFGGVLADTYDRRKTMIILECIGCIVSLSYLLATRLGSIVPIYIAAFLQRSIEALEAPSSSAIFPMFVESKEELKKATTLCVLMESMMAAVGAAMGGAVVAAYGVQVCFVINSLDFVASALLMWLMGGTWHPSDDKDSESEDEESDNDDADDSSEKPVSCWKQYVGMTLDAIQYLRTTFFGSLVLLKCSAALAYGAIDVLEVSFSERPDGTDESNSLRLGILFALSGVGSLLGTIVAEYVTDMNKPWTLQAACVWSFAFISVAFLAMGLFDPFVAPCISTMVDSASATLLWIDSDLLIQTYTRSNMLGRVSAFDYSLSTLTEAASALLAGVLQDYTILTAQQISLLMSLVAAGSFLLWFMYHTNGHGAASTEAKTWAKNTPFGANNRRKQTSNDEEVET